jgi:hypothetical protein
MWSIGGMTVGRVTEVHGQNLDLFSGNVEAKHVDYGTILHEVA